MKPRTLLPGLGLASVLLAPAVPAEPQAPLRFNPFAAPDLARAETGQVGAPGASAQEAWQPVLRATLSAEDESLADLGGVLLAVGESHRGWRLMEVGEFEAVFERQGERVTLPIAPLPTEGPSR